MDTATSIADTLANSYNGTGERTLYQLNEGEEDEEFWPLLGGQGLRAYPWLLSLISLIITLYSHLISFKITLFHSSGTYPESRPGESVPQEPRLFQCSNVTGSFSVDEIINFSQEDLVDDDVMLLDTFNSVFIWVGSQANDEEKKMSLQVAQQYIDASTDGRDEDTPIMR